MSQEASATLEFEVADEDTAARLGSGDLPVLGTPRLVAWCEATTVAAISSRVGDQQTSVGSRVRIEHLSASPVGERVSVTARVVYAEDRLLRFEVVARCVDAADDEKLLAHGEVTRVIVDRDRFLARLSRPSE